MIRAEEFRQDLHDRLAFAVIDVPPLRKRRHDIPLLVAHFEQAFLREMPNLAWQGFSEPAMRELCNYYWPGNVRQLRNLVERLMIMDHDGAVQVADLPPEVIAVSAPGETFTERVAAFEQQLLLAALRAADFRLTEAAESLGLTYDQFRYWYRKYNLRRFDPGGENSLPTGENHRYPEQR
jgi:DNA-binding NtrC family response regulator